MAEPMTDAMEAAAMHGIATNRAYSGAERLGAALQALDWYEAERDAMRPVVEAARAWRAQFSRPADTKYPRMGALIAAVDALDGDAT